MSETAKSDSSTWSFSETHSPHNSTSGDEYPEKQALSKKMEIKMNDLTAIRLFYTYLPFYRLNRPFHQTGNTINNLNAINNQLRKGNPVSFYYNKERILITISP
jgi:hypothetical protein